MRFPDDFIFYRLKESVRLKIGMAVSIDGEKIILQALLKIFAQVKCPLFELTDRFYKAKCFKLRDHIKSYSHSISCINSPVLRVKRTAFINFM